MFEHAISRRSMIALAGAVSSSCLIARQAHAGIGSLVAGLGGQSEPLPELTGPAAPKFDVTAETIYPSTEPLPEFRYFAHRGDLFAMLAELETNEELTEAGYVRFITGGRAERDPFPIVPSAGDVLATTDGTQTSVTVHRVFDMYKTHDSDIGCYNVDEIDGQPVAEGESLLDALNRLGYSCELSDDDGSIWEVMSSVPGEITIGGYRNVEWVEYTLALDNHMLLIGSAMELPVIRGKQGYFTVDVSQLPTDSTWAIDLHSDSGDCAFCVFRVAERIENPSAYTFEPPEEQTPAVAEPAAEEQEAQEAAAARPYLRLACPVEMSDAPWGAEFIQQCVQNAQVADIEIVEYDMSMSFQMMIDLVIASDVDMAIAPSRIAFDAVHGAGEYEGWPEFPECIRTLGALCQTSPFRVLSWVGTGIDDLAYLNGMWEQVGVYPVGISLTPINRILAAYSDRDDTLPNDGWVYVDSEYGLNDLLYHGRLAVVEYGGDRALIEALELVPEFDMLSLDAEHVAAIVDAYPYLGPATIPAGTYPGIDHDVTTVSPELVLLVRNDMDIDLAYSLCECIFGSMGADLNASQTDDSAPNRPIQYASMGIAAGARCAPYHEGASTFFSDNGYVPPL